MGAERAAGDASEDDQRRRGIDREFVADGVGGARGGGEGTGVRRAGRRYVRVPYVRIRNRRAVRAAIRRRGRDGCAVERRVQSAGAGLWVEPRGGLRADGGAVRSGGERAGWAWGAGAAR